MNKLCVLHYVLVGIFLNNLLYNAVMNLFVYKLVFKKVTWKQLWMMTLHYIHSGPFTRNIPDTARVTSNVNLSESYLWYLNGVLTQFQEIPIVMNYSYKFCFLTIPKWSRTTFLQCYILFKWPFVSSNCLMATRTYRSKDLIWEK